MLGKTNTTAVISFDNLVARYKIRGLKQDDFVTLQIPKLSDLSISKDSLSRYMNDDLIFVRSVALQDQATFEFVFSPTTTPLIHEALTKAYAAMNQPRKEYPNLATVLWSIEQKATQDEDSVMQGYVGLTYGYSNP